MLQSSTIGLSKTMMIHLYQKYPVSQKGKYQLLKSKERMTCMCVLVACLLK